MNKAVHEWVVSPEGQAYLAASLEEMNAPLPAWEAIKARLAAK
jgi:hypothetical protein